MTGNLKLAAGLAAGYVLGARAGRERYEQLVEAARQVADRPEVQQLAGRLRSGLETGVDKAASAAGDRLRQARSSGPGERSRTGQEHPAPESVSVGQDEERERSERSRTTVRR